MNTSDPLPAARVAALFTSDLSAAGDPSPAELEQAIRRSVLAHGGVRACCAAMAATYGDYPEIAVPRTRWARRIVAGAYPSRSIRRGRRAAATTVAPYRLAA